MQGRIQRQKAETGTSTTPVASGRVSNSSSTSSVAGRIQRQKAETQPSASVVDSKVPEVKKTTKKNSKLDDIGIGTGAGLLESASFASHVGEKYVIQPFFKLFGMKFDDKSSAQKLQSLVEQKTGKEEGTLFEPENETQAVAKAVEQIAEYFVPGGLATKAGKAMKTSTLLNKAPKVVQKTAPYLVEGITDATLSTPLVLKNTQNASEEDRDSELAWNAGIAVAAPGLMKVAGKALKPLGRLFRKRKAITETIEEASKLADEIAPKAKSVDGITAPKASSNAKNLDEGINIPGKGITDQNGAVLDLRQADNTKPKIAGRIQREAVGQKESRFAQTVAKSDITDPALKTAIKADAPVYDVVTNPETQRRALSRIASEGTERAASFVRNAPEPDADVVTTGVELIKKYQADKQFDLAADMAADVSERLSKSGQAIQAAKIYENLSPESVLVKAQRFIKEQNAKNTLFSGKQKLTEADSEKLYELAQKMQSLNGDAKTELAAEIGGILGSYKRTSVGKKLASAQTQAQLLNPKTAMRNIIGNELFYRLERVTKLLATPIDIARSTLTGTERTITFKSGNQEKFWKNWMKGARAGWKGLDLGPSTVYDIKNHTFKNKLNPFYWGEKAVGAMLKSFDYAAYKRAYGETLYELAYLKAKKEGLKGPKLKQRAIKLLDSMDSQAHELADQYGKYVTFQDDSLLSKMAVGVKGFLNVPTGGDFGFGDLILKYPRTPANLLDRALDYSPVGFVKSFKTIAEPILFGAKKGAAQNREIAMATSRALVGTLGFTGFGYFLADKGMITGKRSSNRNINSLEEEMGKGEYKINVSAIKRFVMSGFKNTRIQNGDTYFTYDWAQPVSVALSIGANMNGGTAAGVVENVVSGVNTIVEQPLLSGVLNFMKYGDITKSLTTTMEGAGASFTPTLLNQFRQYTDNIKRQTRGETFGETFVNRIENRIPGQSEELAPQVGVLGNVKENYENNNIFNVFLNPGNVTTYKEIPEAKLVLDLIEQTGENKHAPKVVDKTATLFGRPEILTPEEQAAMQQYAGTEVMKSLDIAVNSEKFKALTPEEQVDVISRKLTEIGSNIRAILMARRAQDAKKAGDEEAIKFMQENVSPTDVTRFNAAYQYLKEKNPFEIKMPEKKEEPKEEKKDDDDKPMGALPMIGAGLGMAAVTRGKETELLEKGVKQFKTRVAKLLATHSTTKEGIEGILKEKKIWGPSVAVFDKNKVKNMFGFGNYHMVVNKKSIDPSNKDVMMFTDDVFSPRMVSSEASVKKLAADVNAGKDLRGGEIDKGQLPIHATLAERVKSMTDLFSKEGKLGSRQEAKDSYINTMVNLTKNFEGLVPSDIRADMSDLELFDLAESTMTRLAKLKTVNGLTDPRGIKALMKKDYGLQITDSAAKKFVDNINEAVNEIKVEYFEGKILRGLDLDEIDTVLVPTDADIDTIMALQKAGMKTELYHNVGTKEEKSLAFKEALDKVSKSAFGIGIMPFGFGGKKLLEKKLAERDALRKKRDELAKENQDLRAKLQDELAFREVLTTYKVRDGKYAGENKTIGNIDLVTKPYATNPDHVKSIRKIYNQMGEIDATKFVSELERLKSPLVADSEKILRALEYYDITPREFLAVIRQDSGAGTTGAGAKTNNPGNVGNTDDGSLEHFDTWLEGSIAAIRNLAERKVK